MKTFVIIILVMMAGIMPAAAVQPGEQLPDPALELRARRISAELRCLVCQNQSIDDSDAELARDLRRLVRERITAGDDDSAIRTYLVARYGEFVLLKPPVSLRTALLWGLPGLALLFGAVLARSAFRRNTAIDAAAGVEPPLSEAEKARVQGILSGSKDA